MSKLSSSIPKVSRRDFLKGTTAGLATVASGVSLPFNVMARDKVKSAVDFGIFSARKLEGELDGA